MLNPVFKLRFNRIPRNNNLIFYWILLDLDKMKSFVLNFFKCSVFTSYTKFFHAFQKSL